ncbi:GNAT family N-acetyltransferase [Streptomyces sp. NPDC041068]|uniref:GNAT family N-acetyltransferase n=1 Tax=Streptomyces sp. NPDC041068 TaxID=3155130 RepID=UPI0033C202DF
MIEVAPVQLPTSDRWFSAGAPGPALVAEHALTTGIGHWWADDADRPRTLAVTCAGHAMLRGTPERLTAEALAPLADTHVDAPARFLPALRAAFAYVTPGERMVWTQQAAPHEPPPSSRAVRVRRLEPADTDALLALGPDSAWISASWGGPLGLAASGHAWGAVDRGEQLLAVACAYFRGTRHEEVAALPLTGHRRHALALSCVTALTDDIRARGHIPSWNCSTLDRPSRLLAWTAGFRLEREYVDHAVSGVRR